MLGLKTMKAQSFIAAHHLEPIKELTEIPTKFMITAHKLELVEKDARQSKGHGLKRY